MSSAIKYPVLYFKAHPMLLKSSYVAASALLGFGAGDLTIGNGLLSGLIGLLTAVLIALIGKQPAMRQHKLSAHEQEIKFYQSRIRYHSRLERIGRQRTHSAINEVNRLTLFAHSLLTVCALNKLDVAAYKFKSYDDICGEFDQQLLQLEAADIADAADEREH